MTESPPTNFPLYAERFLQGRISSLVNDVLVCSLPALWEDTRLPIRELERLPHSKFDGLSKYVADRLVLPSGIKNERENFCQFAQTPALLACLTTVELLGALFSGCGRRYNRADFKGYAQKYMQYDHGESDLIFQVFRHTLAHYATLGAVVIVKGRIQMKSRNLTIQPGKRVAWSVSFGLMKDHLRIQTLSDSEIIGGTVAPWPIPADYKLYIDITKLLEDICSSVFGANGYLKELRTDGENLMRKFYATFLHLHPSESVKY